MSLCGCFGVCDCLIQANGTVGITGSGDVADPYIITGTETPFDLTSASLALPVTPGGPDGHTPSIDFAIDPTSTAPVSVTGTGLKIDCCPASAPSLDPSVCNEGVDSGGGLYVDSGWSVVNPSASIAVGVQSPGNPSPDSWDRSVTNNEDCDILVRVGGQVAMDLEIQVGATAAEVEVAARLEIRSAHAFVGGGTQRSHRMLESVPTVLSQLNDSYSFRAKLDDHVVLPSGETLDLASYIFTTKRANFDGIVANGNGYEFLFPYILVQRMRRTDLDVVGSG